MVQKTLLLIEDDAATARLLSITLERKGYKVITASNGLVGLKIAREEPFSLILLDLMLPGLDGFEVLSRLQENKELSELPVIILSAKSRPSDKERATELGARAYLTKPYHINVLIEEIEKYSMVPPKQKEKRSSASVVLIGPRAAEVASVAVKTGLVLAQQGEEVTVVDLHPYSVEHALQLEIVPTNDALLLNELNQETLPTKLLHHSSGLKLLNNLVGSSGGGQLNKVDLETLSNVLLDQEQIVLFDLPLHPPELLSELAPISKLSLIVTEDQPATLGATRSALALLKQFHVPEKEIAFVLFSKDKEAAPPTELSVLATLPLRFEATHPALQKLAEQIKIRLGFN